MSEIAVVSVGAATAVGLNARQTGFLLRAGYPAMAEAPLADAEGEAITMAFLPTLDGRLTGPERLAALARAPCEEAMSPIGDLAAEVYVTLDEDLPDVPRARDLLGAMIRGVAPSATAQIEPGGEAGAGALLSAALRSLTLRSADVVVIGGVHSDHDPRAIAALDAGGRLFSRENLDARIPGEAAAFFVLMRDADARRRRLTPLARVLGVGAGVSRATPDNDVSAHEALGLTTAVRQATEGVAAAGQTIGWMLSDLTFEMWRQLEWQSMFIRVQDILGRPYHGDAPAQRIGYLGAAALPLFVALGATGFHHGYAPAPRLLATAGNDRGARAALVLGQPSED